MKTLKRIGKICAKSIAILMGVLFVLYALCFLPPVQKKLISFISTQVEKSIGLNLNFTEVSYSLWTKVTLHNVVLTNYENDTVLVSKKVYVNIKEINSYKKQVDISAITLTNPKVTIEETAKSTWNIAEFLKKVVYKKSATPWVVELAAIEINNGDIRFKRFNKKQTTGINFRDLHVRNVDTRISKFSKHGSLISAYIDKFQGKEKSGFFIAYLQTHFSISPKELEIMDCMLFTNDSKIVIDSARFSYNSYADFSKFTEKVSIQSKFQLCHIALNDIGFFTKHLLNNPYEFSISGSLKGTVSDFRLKDIELLYGDYTFFKGSVEMVGLPVWKETYMHIDVKKFETHIHDLAHLQKPPFTTENFIALPDFVKRLSYISYKGVFNGFYNDFVSYGTFITDLGELKTDILLSQNQKYLFAYKGAVQFNSFDIGTLLVNSKYIGKASGVVDAEGYVDKQGVPLAQIDAKFGAFAFNSYNYTNIVCSGLLTKNKFDGNLSVDDPNVNLTFNGLFDFSKPIPEYVFTMDLHKANLSKIGFYNKDTLAHVTCNVKVNLLGKNFENMQGSSEVSNLELRTKQGVYNDSFIGVNLLNEGDYKKLTFISDFADLEFSGLGSYSEIPACVTKILQKHISYLPSHFKLLVNKKISPHAKLLMQIKKIMPLLAIVYPSIEIAEKSTVVASFSQANNDLQLEVLSPYVRYKDKEFFNVHAQCVSTVYDLNATVLFDYNTFKKSSLDFTIAKDSIDISLFWNSKTTAKTTGKLEAKGLFLPPQMTKMPVLSLNFKPTSLTLQDSVWDFSNAHSLIDGKNITITNASISRKNQIVSINGSVSENPNHVLHANFNQFDLTSLNAFLPHKFAKFEGQVIGKMEIKQLYETPRFFLNIEVPKTKYNGLSIGKLTASSKWLASEKSIGMHLLLQQGTIDVLSAKGVYVPESQDINFSIAASDLNISIFRDFLQGTVNNISGYLDGRIQLKGKLHNPQMLGDLEIKRGKMYVDFTNVPYSFKGKLLSSGSKLQFYDMVVTDTLKNKGIVEGFVDLKKIVNPEYEFRISTPKLLVFNKKEKIGDYFYGTVFYEGDAKIAGNLQSVKITGSGTTLDNTICNIPLTNYETIEKVKFLSFKDTSSLSVSKKLPINTIKQMDIEVLLNVKVTPTALTQLIFDKRVGDIIKVRGNGDLQIMLDKQRNFYMFGEVNVTDGDYLFTFKNFVNKKFHIQNGGRISWTGDPFDAKIDITARYEVKASPQAIMDTTYSRRIPVVCLIDLKNNLLKPDITYDISVPSNYTEVQEVLSTLSSDEKNMQFLYLMALNSFYSQNQNSINMGNVTFELLSNQLTHLFSQMNAPVDVGVNIRSADNVYNTTNELELALSKQFFNNWVSVNVLGTTEFGDKSASTGTTNTNDFAGDISVEVKLTQQGNVKLKGFSRTNQNPLDETKDNINGISLFYSKEFNSFKDLFRKQKRQK